MKKLNSAWLPYAGAAVQAGLFGMAGSRYFGAYGWLVGLGVGAVVNASLAVASSRVSEIAAKRRRLAYLAMGGLFTLSPVVITLSLFAPANIATAIAWASAVDLAIVLAGAIAGKSLVQVGEQEKQVRKEVRATPKKSAAVRRSYPRKCEHCAQMIGSPQAVGGHMKKHHPELCAHKLYAVDLSKKGE